MNNKYVFFDIGAHNGKSSLHVANDPNKTVYAFEPVPEFYNYLRSITSHIDNYHVYNNAISNFIGKSTFNICSTGRKSQCSSLLEFSDKSILDKYWTGYNNFNYTEQIEVDVITLKYFIEKNNIQQIDYLHCDAQGCDLNVLKSLDEYINCVIEGVIECAKNDDVKLYKNQHSYEESIIFLEKNNFSITNISSNNNIQTEYNIFFKKR